jgi:hypothetical protein
MMAPMIISNRNTGDLILAGVASGGPDAPVSVGTAARQVLRDGMPLPTALAATGGIQVGMLACPRGLREARTLCQVGTNPRGYGLALTSAR